MFARARAGGAQVGAGLAEVADIAVVDPGLGVEAAVRALGLQGQAGFGRERGEQRHDGVRGLLPQLRRVRERNRHVDEVVGA